MRSQKVQLGEATITKKKRTNNKLLLTVKYVVREKQDHDPKANDR